MTASSQEGGWVQRFARALIIVGVLVCAVPVSELVLQSIEGASKSESFVVQGLEMEGAADPFAVLSKIEQKASNHQGRMPAEVVEEMGVLPGASAGSSGIRRTWGPGRTAVSSAPARSTP